MTPVVFENRFGWLHPAPGGRGVVLCPPYGYEALCTHRGWREIAETLAAAGIRSLGGEFGSTLELLAGALQLSRPAPPLKPAPEVEAEAGGGAPGGNAPASPPLAGEELEDAISENVSCILFRRGDWDRSELATVHLLNSVVESPVGGYLRVDGGCLYATASLEGGPKPSSPPRVVVEVALPSAVAQPGKSDVSEAAMMVGMLERHLNK